MEEDPQRLQSCATLSSQHGPQRADSQQSGRVVRILLHGATWGGAWNRKQLTPGTSLQLGTEP